MQDKRTTSGGLGAPAAPGFDRDTNPTTIVRIGRLVLVRGLKAWHRQLAQMDFMVEAGKGHEYKVTAYAFQEIRHGYSRAWILANSPSLGKRERLLLDGNMTPRLVVGERYYLATAVVFGEGGHGYERVVGVYDLRRPQISTSAYTFPSVLG